MATEIIILCKGPFEGPQDTVETSDVDSSTEIQGAVLTFTTSLSCSSRSMGVCRVFLKSLEDFQAFAKVHVGEGSSGTRISTRASRDLLEAS